MVKTALLEVEELRKSIGKISLDHGTLARLASAEDKLNYFSVETKLQRFGDMTPSEVVVYQRVFGALTALASSPGSVRELIEMVFAEASKVGQVGPGINPDQRMGNNSQARLDLNETGTVTPR